MASTIRLSPKSSISHECLRCELAKSSIIFWSKELNLTLSEMATLCARKPPKNLVIPRYDVEENARTQLRRYRWQKLSDLRKKLLKQQQQQRLKGGMIDERVSSRIREILADAAREIEAVCDRGFRVEVAAQSNAPSDPSQEQTFNSEQQFNRCQDCQEPECIHPNISDHRNNSEHSLQLQEGSLDQQFGSTQDCSAPTSNSKQFPYAAKNNTLDSLEGPPMQQETFCSSLERRPLCRPAASFSIDSLERTRPPRQAPSFPIYLDTLVRTAPRRQAAPFSIYVDTLNRTHPQASPFSIFALRRAQMQRSMAQSQSNRQAICRQQQPFISETLAPTYPPFQASTPQRYPRQTSPFQTLNESAISYGPQPSNRQFAQRSPSIAEMTDVANQNRIRIAPAPFPQSNLQSLNICHGQSTEISQEVAGIMNPYRDLVAPPRPYPHPPPQSLDQESLIFQVAEIINRHNNYQSSVHDSLLNKSALLQELRELVDQIPGFYDQSEMQEESVGPSVLQNDRVSSRFVQNVSPKLATRYEIPVRRIRNPIVRQLAFDECAEPTSRVRSMYQNINDQTPVSYNGMNDRANFVPEDRNSTLSRVAMNLEHPSATSNHPECNGTPSQARQRPMNDSGMLFTPDTIRNVQQDSSYGGGQPLNVNEFLEGRQQNETCGGQAFELNALLKNNHPRHDFVNRQGESYAHPALDACPQYRATAWSTPRRYDDSTMDHSGFEPNFVNASTPVRHNACNLFR